MSVSDDRTRGRIIGAASALLARAPRSSLAEVAAAAGVGRTTVHRYFPTRDALVDALALVALERIGAAVEAARIDDGDARTALARLVAGLLPLADEHQFASSADLPEMRVHWERLDGEVSRLIDRGKASGDFRADLPTPVVVDALAGLIWSISCSVADGRAAARTAPRDLLVLLTDGIAT